MSDTDESQSGATALEVKNLEKTFFIGFFRKRVDAVRGISLRVEPGEFFGLLGPNGAGKTTTIKMILRLIFPTSGEIEIFGKPPTREVMGRVGYMPENPYVYRYLKPLEFLDLAGRLSGMGKKERLARAEELLDEVNLRHAIDRPIGRFSKGMMQRVGLAQALLHDPDLLILDEPLSGLDPICRKELRDILLAQKAKGRTVIFTSHILSDVERLCDRVVILQRGKITHEGLISELLAEDIERQEIELAGVSAELREALESFAIEVHDAEGTTLASVSSQTDLRKAVDLAGEGGARIVGISPQRKSLENLFVESKDDAAPPAP